MSTEAVHEGESSVYVLGRTTEEYDRLRGQAQILEPITSSVLEGAGLSVGMSCLDVGSGPGEVMRLMADRVGSSGRVVGLDVDGRLGARQPPSWRAGATPSARLSKGICKVSNS
jgi:tRNA A58 N-methylase Trm61